MGPERDTIKSDPLYFFYDPAPQLSPEWFARKRGKIGGSRMSDWLAVRKTKDSKTNGKPLKKRLDYETELMFERQFNTSFSTYVNSAMQEGIDYEEFAAEEYARLNKVILGTVGCWYNDFVTVSPDRAIYPVGRDTRDVNNSIAGIEVKIVKDNTFTEILTDGVPEKHYAQIQTQLWGTSWDYVDYMALNFNTKKFIVIRVLPDTEFIEYMKLAVQENLVVKEFDLENRVFDITQEIPEDIELGAPIDRSDSNTTGGWN